MPPPDSDTPPRDQTHGPVQPTAVPDSYTLDQFGPDGVIRPPDAEAAGSRAAGRYRILRPHAHGGLGEVFLAHDDELDRDVALKRIRPFRADDPASRRRFVAEAAVTARLEHPGVVPVHGLVQDSAGRPAYAMRFIQGDTLDDAIKHFHGSAVADDGKKSASEIIIGALTGPPSPQFDSLEFRQLLARFVAVCNAIAFAHSRGIIHRDLKPANVMLGPFGETLVVDWGLAKDLARGAREAPGSSSRGNEEAPAPGSMHTPLSGDSETEAGEILGTPAYMAPEQAAAEPVGPPADVYGLGAILYVMLTGQPPVSGKGGMQVALHRVRFGDFPSPRQVLPAVPRPLDAVCRRAMAASSTDRYASALDLAADVERWLADEPVSCDRVPLRERIGRWSRRHRTMVTAGVALLVTAVVGLAVATTLISHQQAATEAAKKKAEEQRDRADQNLRLAARAVDAAATRVSGNLRLMAGDFHDLRVELLAALIPFYEELARQTGDDPAVQYQSGMAYGWLGNLRREMGQSDQAERDLRAYISVFTHLSGQDPADPDFRRRLAGGRSDLGNMLADLGKWTDARAELNQAVQLERDAVAANPSDLDARRSLATGLNGLAVVVENGRPPGNAEPMYLEALELARGLVSADSSNPALVGLCAGIENNLAVFFRRMGRPGDAKPLFRSAIDRRTKLATSDPADRHNREALVDVRYNLANLLRATGQIPAAEAEYQATIGIAEKLATDFSSMPNYRLKLGKVLQNQAAMFGTTGRAREAAGISQRAAELFDRLAADFPGTLDYLRNGGDSWFTVGLAMQKIARPADAETAFRRAAANYGRQAAEAPADPKPTADLAITWVMLGDLAQTTGNTTGALEWYDRAITRLAGAPGEGALRDAHVGRAESLTTLGRHADALKAWDVAIALGDDPLFRMRRARTRVLLGDHRSAATEVKQLANAPKTRAEMLDGAARILAMAAAAAKSDPAVANGYAADAVAFLRRAHAAGRYREPGSAEKLRGDADFAPLRERDDFKKFVTEVGK